MSKKKKDKKKIKEDQKKLEELSLDKIIEQSENFTKSGKIRESIDILKTGVKKYGLLEQLKHLLFQAYKAREIQLREKGMHKEADVVKSEAKIYMPSIDKFSEKDIFSVIIAASNKEAFEIYGKYLKQGHRSIPSEKNLANRLIEHQDWTLLSFLDESTQLKRDALIVEKAITFMDNAEWEKALDIIAPIGRNSSFSSLKMFCKAIVSFHKEDDSDTLKALSMIAEDFPLMDIVTVLKSKLSKSEVIDKPNTMDILNCFWDKTINIGYYVDVFAKTIEKNDNKQMENLIIPLAKILYPKDATRAIFDLLSIYCFNLLHRGANPNICDKIAFSILKQEDLANYFMKKITLFDFDRLILNSLVDVVSSLKYEFPNEQDRNIAISLLIFKFVSIARNNNFVVHSNREWDEKRKILNITSKDRDEILLKLVYQGIKFDKENKEGYKLLLSLPRKTRKDRDLVYNCLTEMAGQFPDDPFPFLEMSSIHYENNAFRKAEKALEDAMKRAPYDNRVIEQHAISLLYTAEKNISKNLYHLVKNDIERAENLDNIKSRPFIAAKKILFGLLIAPISTPNEINVHIKEKFANTSLIERLFTIGLMLTDLKKKEIDIKISVIQVELLKILKLENISSISSSEIIKLLKPLDKKYSLIFPNNNFSIDLFEPLQDKILQIVKDSDIINLFDYIFHPPLFSVIKNEIKKRKKRADKTISPILEFFDVTIDHFKGKKFHRPEKYYRILDNASNEVINELKAISKQLAKKAEWPLKEALERFEFDILYDDYHNFNDFDDFPAMPPNLPPEFVDDLFDDRKFKKEFIRILDMLEDLIDEEGLRDAPIKEIKKFREHIKHHKDFADVEMISMFIRMGRLKISNLSPELRALLGLS
ncbi:MAG: hypothetical protein HQK76_11555 [Desulfobacterales bacterium]|nr:hypothetical protein [Desulfobacterales bacterium]